MQFLCAPLLGAISDRFGRRLVLIAAIVGLGLHYLLIATAPSLWVMLVARFMGGVTGASFSVANAYLADISPPEERAKSFGLIGAAFGLGFICRAALGRRARRDRPASAVLRRGGACRFVNALYGYFVVPESLPPDRRRQFSLAKANPFRALIALVQHHAVGSLVIVFALFALAHMAMIQNWALFTHFRFGWGTFENGILLFCVGVAVDGRAGRTARPPRQALRRGAARADRDRQQRARPDRLRARAAGLDDVPDPVLQLS